MPLYSARNSMLEGMQWYIIVHIRPVTYLEFQVMFKGVPLEVPDEEIINLCKCYGEPINNEVIYKAKILPGGLLVQQDL